uniref:Cytochrome P450 71D180 n=3 Tax=Thymus vulgaris TaxID=49992 RepID=CP180_THYVU|nr:RecName: Full=Cytochrome P450 71D180; AltName: Full=Carvacrol synthase; AltName: Full=Carveol synthase; AltName: Full=Gamma-terpinene hydroxylase; AltName: Full=Limonene hydroxylase [Thymus vulgaris]QEU48954.1 cytochrome P450 monooxygenase CYP71D180 [Thymus vulgaris]
MDISISWVVIIVFVLSYLILMDKWRASKLPGNLPPSPPKLPVIGHLHLLRGGLPQHVLRGITQKYGAVAHLQLGEVHSVVLSSAESTKQAMKVLDPTFADRFDSIGSQIMWYNNDDMIFSRYNDHWRQIRKICVSELLSPRNVRSFGFIRQDEMARLIRVFESSEGAAINASEEISKMSCAIVCRAAFGSVLKDQGKLADLVKEALSMASGFELADLYPSSWLLNLLCFNKYRLQRMRGRLDNILDGFLEEHKVKKSGEFGGEDIIDVLYRMQKDTEMKAPITNNGIKGFIFDVFSAGTETSATTIQWALSELMKNPEKMVKAQAEVREKLKGKTNPDVADVQELKYLHSVVKETLRLHPPFPLIPRLCKEECEVTGYTIPAKTRILVNVWSIGRDPAYWKDPDTFNPDRFDEVSRDVIGNDFELIPFGAGRRVCPGLHFGLANVEVPLAQLLYHFDYKLPSAMTAADMDMSETPGLSGPRKNPLIMIPTIHNPTS